MKLTKTSTAAIVGILILVVIASVLAVYYFFVQQKAPVGFEEAQKTGCALQGEGCGGLTNLYAKCCSSYRCANSNPFTGGVCTLR